MPNRTTDDLPHRPVPVPVPGAARPAPRAGGRRRLVLGAAVLAGAASVAVLLTLPSLGACPGADAAPRSPEGAPPAVDGPPAAPRAAIGPEPAPSPAPAAARPSGPPPPIRRLPHRLARGAPAPVELFAGLRALGPDVSSRCADEAPRVGRRGRPPASFLLDFESANGAVQIVEAAVFRRGGASDDFLACARSALLGNQIRVAVARAGTRFQLPIELTP